MIVTKIASLFIALPLPLLYATATCLLPSDFFVMIHSDVTGGGFF